MASIFDILGGGQQQQQQQQPGVPNDPFSFAAFQQQAPAQGILQDPAVRSRILQDVGLGLLQQQQQQPERVDLGNGFFAFRQRSSAGKQILGAVGSALGRERARGEELAKEERGEDRLEKREERAQDNRKEIVKLQATLRDKVANPRRVAALRKQQSASATAQQKKKLDLARALGQIGEPLDSEDPEAIAAHREGKIEGEKQRILAAELDARVDVLRGQRQGSLPSERAVAGLMIQAERIYSEETVLPGFGSLTMSKGLRDQIQIFFRNGGTLDSFRAFVRGTKPLTGGKSTAPRARAVPGGSALPRTALPTSGEFQRLRGIASGLAEEQ